MRRIGLLTAGGDTPALNATIHGAVTRASAAGVEVYGLIKGFNSLFNPRLPHVHLNPLFQPIPELDPTIGGTLLGASRDYLDGNDHDAVSQIVDRLKRLNIDGLICIGGDGTLNGMQALAASMPVVLAPKTIDNDLGLNYLGEPREWLRTASEAGGQPVYRRSGPKADFDVEEMVNFVTPGFATAVFVAAVGVERVRTTAESHRRIAIIEVMGRESGFIALGSAYGQPDLVLIPEQPIDIDRVLDRILEIYETQKNVVIVCGEGIRDESGVLLGAQHTSTDPAGNKTFDGAADALRQRLIQGIGDRYFRERRRGDTAREMIFTRKVGHTQRGGRPLLFDRFYAAQLGGAAVDLLLDGFTNTVSMLKWTRAHGFKVEGVPVSDLLDDWGHIHARKVHPGFYDSSRMRVSALGVEYLQQIFTGAVGHDDTEHLRERLFTPGRLLDPHRSINALISRRIEYLVGETPGRRASDLDPEQIQLMLL
jgi:ATP-dependent phosphofructokinase / diphosphate-dependent phosphofructokinase